MTGRRLAILTGAAMTVVALALVALHLCAAMPLARRVAGAAISDAGAVVQLVALIAGVVAVNLVPGPVVRWVIAAEGAACLLAWGVTGLALAGTLGAAWLVLDAGRLGRRRFALGAALVVAIDACAWATHEVAAAALLFNMMFAMRLFVFAYDRWQTDEPTPLGDYLAYMLVAPLVIVPPYFAIIPMYDGFVAKIRPGLTGERLRKVARHLALGAAFAGGRAVYEWAGFPGDVAAPADMYARVVANVVDLAVLAYLLVPLLLLHGIEERMPLDRPLLSTSFVELWQRLNSHVKDAQVFLFYTPALLHLRRGNRYVAIVLATCWTMLVGNTLLHVAIRYCFLADTWDKIVNALIANAIMAAALSYELCRAARRDPGATPVPSAVRWFLTMTVAAVVASL